MCTSEENGIANETIVLDVGGHTLLSVNRCCFMQKPILIPSIVRELHRVEVAHPNYTPGSKKIVACNVNN